MIIHKRCNVLTIISLLVTFTILIGFCLTQVTIKARAVTGSANASVTVGSACTLAKSVTSAHTASITNGTYYGDGGIGETLLQANCNDASGFAIYAIGYTGNESGANYLRDNILYSTYNDTYDITTGTGTSGSSNWSMKLTSVSNADTPVIQNSYDSYHNVPNEYALVANKASGTTIDDGARVKATYTAYISGTQPAGTYEGKVKYALVHPATKPAPYIPHSINTTAGQICYYPNTNEHQGTIGCQTVSTSATSITLLASNFSRTGYGFAGWSDAYDYDTNPNAHFYGPQEDITFTAGQYTGSNPGLSLYAVWVKSAGSLQDSTKVAQLCGTGTGSLTTAVYDNKQDEDESTWSINAGLSSISALTDSRDGETYAIAKLTDGNCWMIENLRLADTHQEGANTVATTLTTTNTNNPLNDGNATNPTVTLKHNYSDSTTYNTLSATSSVAYNADTAPDGWCTTNSATCNDQSRLRTDSTANRATNSPNTNSGSMYSYGNYYNWYSATAGRGTYSKFSGVTDGDLCPAGWHLPYGGSGTGTKGGNTTGGFNYLANSMVATSSNAINSNKHRTFPNNFVYSGYVNGASVNNRGSYGGYWSSTAYGSNYAYTLFFYSSSVSPGTGSDYKYNGRSVRCTASSS